MKYSWDIGINKLKLFEKKYFQKFIKLFEKIIIHIVTLFHDYYKNFQNYLYILKIKNVDHHLAFD